MQARSRGDQAPSRDHSAGGDGSVQRHLRQPVHVPLDQAQDDVDGDVVEPAGQVLAGQGIFLDELNNFVFVHGVNNCIQLVDLVTWFVSDSHF